ncbi:hypothetical protein [Permianibacter aggregans]|uniref:Uncharacterized protein n=1 Tax=Permianibacter aggregans TaxID=1510150 RepID=A0A4R6V1L6_9GAMM|nr:hypothetical protein [Permianibacter aggregans]QGX39318.1 hypothetical protein E2H98_06460 [Permianibacter aggregans]TDQ49944.1 hypothetical protein EV696_103319 [Permianibacter aggregans]
MLKSVWHSRRWRLVLAMCTAVIAFIGATGSAPTYINHTDRTLRPINYGTLVNTELKIEAMDGSFVLQGGEQFRTPFALNLWNARFDEKTLANQYQAARQLGAKPVLVHVKGHDQPLYGLLIFNQAINAAFGPGSQSYYVRVSKDKLDNARFGGISVAYEMMDWRDTYTDDYGRQTRDKTWYGWMLWLSSTPI